MSNTNSEIGQSLREICQSFREIWQSLTIILGIGQPTRTTLWIGLSDSSLRPGRLYIQDHKGRRLLNPIALQTYGVTPIGDYTVMGIRVSGPGTPYPLESYGPEGIVMLENKLKENSYLTIQGGRTTPQNDLLTTKGGFRVNDRDMRAVIIALETIEGPIDCYCVSLEQNESLFDQEDTSYNEYNDRSNY